MALAFVLMVVFVLTWAEAAFHLHPVTLPDYTTILLTATFVWAVFYDIRSK